MNQFKIKRILEEQKILLENISDGAMIYRINNKENEESDEDNESENNFDAIIKKINQCNVELNVPRSKRAIDQT
jgi:hypothetical protein